VRWEVGCGPRINDGSVPATLVPKCGAPKHSFPVSSVNMTMFRKFVAMRCSNRPREQHWRAVCIPEILYCVNHPKPVKPLAFVVCRGEDELLNYMEKKTALLSVVLRTTSWVIEGDVNQEKAFMDKDGITCHFCYNYRIYNPDLLAGGLDFNIHERLSVIYVEFNSEVVFSRDGRISSMTENYDAEGVLSQIQREDSRTLPYRIDNSKLRNDPEMRMSMILRFLNFRLSKDPCNDDWLSVCTPEMSHMLPPTSYRRMSSMGRTRDLYEVEGLEALIDDSELRVGYINGVMIGRRWHVESTIIADSVKHDWQANTMVFSYEVIIYDLGHTSGKESDVGCAQMTKSKTFVLASFVAFDTSDYRLRTMRDIYDTVSVMSWERSLKRRVGTRGLNSSNEKPLSEERFGQVSGSPHRLLRSSMEEIANMRLAATQRFVTMSVSICPRNENWGSVCMPQITHVMNHPTNTWCKCFSRKPFHSVQGINQLIVNTEERLSHMSSIVRRATGEMWTWTVDITINKENVRMTSGDGSALTMTYSMKLYAVQLLAYNIPAARTSWKLLLEGEFRTFAMFSNDGLIDCIYEYIELSNTNSLEQDSDVKSLDQQEALWGHPPRQSSYFSGEQFSQPIPVPPHFVQSQSRSCNSLSEPCPSQNWVPTIHTDQPVSWLAPPVMQHNSHQQYPCGGSRYYPTTHPSTTNNIQQAFTIDGMSTSLLNELFPDESNSDLLPL